MKLTKLFLLAVTGFALLSLPIGRASAQGTHFPPHVLVSR